ncbi:MAG: PDR/VanB family oxidoreductase [Xylophilus ampelinus]
MNDTLLTVRVARKAAEALDICSLELVRADGGPLPAFAAGSHIDLHLPGGLVRQYSLCNEPGETHRYLVAVLRDAAGRGGSRAVHDAMHEGDTLAISAPRNHFALARDASHHLLLAGGIGITPVLCMAERLAVAGEPFALHYCTRSRERTAFADRIAASSFAPAVALHHDDGPDAQKFDLAATLGGAPAGSHLYVCGPKGFMDAVLGAARARGWPEDRLHYEFFGATVEASADDAGFQVKLASSGRLVDVPVGRTVVQALAACGVEVLTSCEQGVCGTCLTRVLEGQPDHKDSYLTPEEQAAGDQFLPCCSRSRSPVLVLDL